MTENTLPTIEEIPADHDAIAAAIEELADSERHPRRVADGFATALPYDVLEAHLAEQMGEAARRLGSAVALRWEIDRRRRLEEADPNSPAARRARGLEPIRPARRA